MGYRERAGRMRQLRGSSKTAGEPAWELSLNRKEDLSQGERVADVMGMREYRSG